MPIQESGEMYLETVYILSQKRSEIHAVDISEHMNFSKPSVSRAVGILKKNGYLDVAANGHITLTDSGKAIAEKIYERHTLLRSYLMCIGVSEETASEDACKIEHVISDETFFALKKHVKNED